MRKLKKLSIISLLAVSSSSYALPFMPMDARGLAMGGTGLASSRLAHAPAYNPSLLTKAEEDDDFAILIPQIGFIAADEGDVIDSGQSIADKTLPKFKKLFEGSGNDNFKSSLENMKTASTDLANEISGLSSLNVTNAQAKYDSLDTKNKAMSDSINGLQGKIREVNQATDELNNKLGDISGDPLRMRVGLATAFAFPGKKLAVGVSLRNDTHISGRATFTQKDRNLLGAYGKAAYGYSENSKVVPDSVQTILDKIEKLKNGDASAQPTTGELSTLKTKVDGVTSYNSSNDDGNVGIIENGQLSNAAKEPKLDSTVQIVGMNVSELGLSFAREFNIKGENVSFGVTPKVVAVQTFHYGTSMENKVKINNDTFQSARTSNIGINLDLGASYRFGDDSGWTAGATIKNLIPKTYKTSDTKLKDENGIETGKTIKGPELKINPQLRVGGAYENSWFVGTVELDITENKPVAFEAPTRYLAAGAEFDLYDTAQLRLGARTNLSAESPLKQSVLSLGFGLSPSIVEMNLAVMANPSNYKREIGLAFEFGLAF